MRKLTRPLVAASAALLAAVVLIGLGQGAVASWFRAIGGGAALGFAVAVALKSRGHEGEEPESLRKIAEGFGWVALAFIAACGVAGGVLNHISREDAKDARAEVDVASYIQGQVFWAGRPLVVDVAVKRFGRVMRDKAVTKLERSKHMGVSDAVTEGPAQGEVPLTVKGLVCSRYKLVPTKVSRKLGYTFVYRMVSPGGNNEVHVISTGTRAEIARGNWIEVTGLVAAAGPRRDHGARNTVFLMGVGPGRNVVGDVDGPGGRAPGTSVSKGLAQKRCHDVAA